MIIFGLQDLFDFFLEKYVIQLLYSFFASSMVINIGSSLVSGKIMHKPPATKLITPNTVPGSHGTSSCRPNRKGVRQFEKP